MTEEGKNICRVCLIAADLTKFLSLFEKYNDSLISDKINSIAKVDICEGDGLPSGICPDCLLELENAFIFKSKCEKSNTILQKLEVYDKNEDEPTLVQMKNEEELKNEQVDDIVDDHKEDIHQEDDHKQVEDLLDHQVDNNIEDVLQEDDPAADFQSHELSSDINFESLNQEVRKSKAIDLKLECHDCGGIFKSKCKLRVHWKKVHKTKLICEICRRMFSTYKTYHLHCKNKKNTCLNAAKVRIEGEGKSRIFHCKDCDYKTKNMYPMNKHLVVHSGERPYSCDKCTSSYTQLSSLHAHKERSHEEYRVEATCQYCGKFLQGRNRLYKHMLTHKPKSVQCDICKKILSTKQILIDHIRRHTGVRPYTCEICGLTFYTLPEMYVHKQRHNKAKTKKCDICGYTASRMETIKRHKAKHTSTNKPCLVCGIFVDNAQVLAIHMKRHLDRPYLCPHCDSTFHARKERNKHIVKKHRLTMLGNHKTKTPNNVK